MPRDPAASGNREQVMRAELKALWQARNAPCGICGQATIDWDGPANAPASFEYDHRLPRRDYPHLALDPGNGQPSHSRCNRSKNAHPQRAGVGVTSETW